MSLSLNKMFREETLTVNIFTSFFGTNYHLFIQIKNTDVERSQT